VLLFIAIIFSALMLQACQHSAADQLPPGKKSGFPVGHDLHPDTDPSQQKGDGHPLPDFS